MSQHEDTPALRWDRMRHQLVDARKRGQISQDEVAAAVGCARNTVGRVERGEHEPSVAHLLAHAQAVDLDVVLVAPHLVRLLALDVADLAALVHAAACATRNRRLTPAQELHVIVALERLRPAREAA